MQMSIDQNDFQRVSTFIYDNLGICLSQSKKTMVESRLAKRVRALGLASVSEYCNFLFSEEGQQFESVHLFDVVTTNKTDFFREPGHFEYLVKNVVDSLMVNRHTRTPLRVWSAGCSSGEEPYTLAMVLEAHSASGLKYNYEIFASDICTKVLALAKRGVYPHDQILPVPMDMRRKFLLKNKNREKPLVRVAPGLQDKVTFFRLNLMDDHFKLPHKMDVIFCRNVIIYFDDQTQEQLIRKFCDCLHAGGFLFLGHSESLHGFDLPLKQVAPTVYQRI
jgi:chemotaxis protein methyltransferase CheR